MCVCVCVCVHTTTRTGGNSTLIGDPLFALRNHSLPAANMPKKKTGQRKKAEKQKARQKELRKGRANRSLADLPCNSVMVRGGGNWQQGNN